MIASEGVVAGRRYLKDLLMPDGDAEPLAVLLVGSWARGSQVDPVSDLDILVVDGSIPRRPPPGVQVISLTQAALRSRVAQGDDFVQWALRFAVPLKGRSAWARLRKDLGGSAPWPSSTRKYEQAAKRLEAARDLLAMGDLSAAQDELRFALSHAARGVLLDRGIFPLSRPELPAQLREAGDSHLADSLSGMDSIDVPPEPQLRAALETGRSRIHSRAQRPHLTQRSGDGIPGRG